MPSSITTTVRVIYHSFNIDLTTVHPLGQAPYSCANVTPAGAADPIYITDRYAIATDALAEAFNYLDSHPEVN